MKARHVLPTGIPRQGRRRPAGQGPPRRQHHPRARQRRVRQDRAPRAAREFAGSCGKQASRSRRSTAPPSRPSTAPRSRGSSPCRSSTSRSTSTRSTRGAVPDLRQHRRLEHNEQREGPRLERRREPHQRHAHLTDAMNQRWPRKGRPGPMSLDATQAAKIPAGGRRDRRAAPVPDPGPVAGPAAERALRRRERRFQHRDKWWGYALIAPTGAGPGGVLPLAGRADRVLQLHRSGGPSAGTTWIGLANYRTAAHDPDLRTALVQHRLVHPARADRHPARDGAGGPAQPARAAGAWASTARCYFLPVVTMPAASRSSGAGSTTATTASSTTCWARSASTGPTGSPTRTPRSSRSPSSASGARSATTSSSCWRGCRASPPPLRGRRARRRGPVRQFFSHHHAAAEPDALLRHRAVGHRRAAGRSTSST